MFIVAGGGGGGTYPSENRKGGYGGGSGYVFTETSVKSTYYDDYLDSSFYLVDTLMLAGNQEMPSKSGIGTTIGNAYNGYIRITVL